MICCLTGNSILLYGQTTLKNDFKIIEKNFAAPPYSVKTAVYWYWLNDHISKEGVVKDLQAMKKAGINRVFIGTNIRNRTSWSRDLTGQYFGKVKMFTKEWYDVLHTALKTATQLNIEVGLFNCPGWSQSGGPWIKPEQAMRYLASSETYVKGPLKLSRQLTKPDAFFQDVKVIAFPVTAGYGQDITETPGAKVIPSHMQIVAAPNPDSAKYILSENESILDIALPQAVTVRSLSLYPAGDLDATAELQVKADTHFYNA